MNGPTTDLFSFHVDCILCGRNIRASRLAVKNEYNHHKKRGEVGILTRAKFIALHIETLEYQTRCAIAYEKRKAYAESKKHTFIR